MDVWSSMGMEEKMEAENVTAFDVDAVGSTTGKSTKAFGGNGIGS